MMSSPAPILKKKGTHANKSSIIGSCPTGTKVRSGKLSSPYVIVTLVAVSLALLATTQVVLCGTLNKALLPPLSLSLDDALAYLSSRSTDEALESY